MKKKRITAAVAGLLALQASVALAECRMDKLVEYHLSPLGDEATVDASVEGIPLKFLVDTGAIDTMFTTSGAEKIKLNTYRIDRARLYGVGGESGAIKEVYIKKLSIGDQIIENASFAITTDRGIGPKVQGVFGEGSFNNADLELDYSHNALRVIHPVRCDGDRVVYWGGNYSFTELEPSEWGFIIVNVLVNGHPVVAEVDTGSSTTVITAKAARAVGVRMDGPDVKMIGTFGGIGPQRMAAYQARFNSIQIGDEHIQNTKLDIADIFGADVESKTGSRIAKEIEGLPEMLIGADFVHAHRIYVARSQGRLYFSYVGGAIFRDHTQTVPPQTATQAQPPPPPPTAK